MEIKQIKCPNCGGKLKVKPDKGGMVTCDYCRNEFSVETNYSKSYDTTKGALDAQMEVFNNSFNNRTFKVMRFAPLMIFGLGLVIMTVIAIFGMKESFNSDFANDAGTKDAFFIDGVFDDVIENNQTRRRQVELCFDETCTKDVMQMVKLKDRIDDYPTYEVVLEYKNGYVSRVNIIPKGNK